MPPKLGNAFSEQHMGQEATNRLNMSQPNDVVSPDGNVTTLNAPDNRREDAPPTPRTSFDMLVGPPTETERRGRSLVREQRAKMVASLKSLSPAKASRKRSNTETSRSSKSTKSERKPALPIEQLFEKVKTRIARKKSRATLQESNMSAVDMNKPLPAINVSATIYPTDPAYSDIPNFLTMPSPSPRYGRFPPSNYNSPASPMNPEARPFVPESPARTDWPLPSSSPMPPPQIVQQAATARATTANPTATLPSGIIFANQGQQFLTPARTGTYTSVQKPVVVPAGPTHASMQASIIDTAPPTPIAAVIPEQGDNDEEDEDEDEDEGQGATGVTAAVLRSELMALYSAVDVRMGRIDGHLERIDGRLERIEARLARLEGAVGRVESLVREERAQLKHQASFGGRYPGDAKDLLAFKQ